MNLLALCQQVNLEATGDSTKPTTVDNQTGRLRNIVLWTIRAHKKIEAMSEAWEFRQIIDNTKILATTTHSYRINTTWAITNFLRFDEAVLFIYDSTISTSDKAKVEFKQYRTFRNDFKSPETSTGRPRFCTVTPNGDVLFDVVPDKSTYVFAFDYVRKVVPLVVDTDQPAFADEYQMVIVWEALADFGRNVLAPEVVKMAREGRAETITRLKERYLPDVEWEMVDPIA